jgi:acetate kinase
MYLLAINCGSSSIKGKLYTIPDLKTQAELSVSNISSKGEKIKIKIEWVEGGEGKDVKEEGEDGGRVKCRLLHVMSG